MHEERGRDRISKAAGSEASYVLWLFVAGDEGNSRRAQENLMRLCEGYLQGRSEIVTYDVLKDFQPALEHRVRVIPTLIRVWPLPRVTILGNLSDIAKVMAALRCDGGKR
jgi:circadian clock protein KaiB